ncbi:unnamed protein product [Amoebophrya sp. A25]|nr:unnamed protein product [Amoebophrya sp. A25]|eukprot:GSA25T00013969001.1
MVSPILIHPCPKPASKNPLLLLKCFVHTGFVRCCCWQSNCNRNRYTVLYYSRCSHDLPISSAEFFGCFSSTKTMDHRLKCETFSVFLCFVTLVTERTPTPSVFSTFLTCTTTCRCAVLLRVSGFDRCKFSVQFFASKHIKHSANATIACLL